MKKSKVSAIFLSIALAAIILLPMVNTAKAYLWSFDWLPPYIYRGYEDRFYDEYIVGYEEGTNATARMNIVNWDYYPLWNITAVILSFDWDENYSAVISPSPYRLPYDESHTFTVTFTVPSAASVSNLYPHDYRLIIEHVDGDGNPLDPYVYYTPSYAFAVYSHDQVSATDLHDKFWTYYGSYYPWEFDESEAQMLAIQATTEADLGDTYYERGDFASSKSQYETAIDLYEEAFTKEGAWGKTYQEAYLNVTLTEAEAATKMADAAMIQADAAMKQADAAMAQADAAMRQADAALNQSYAYLLFGIGFIIIGVGIVIYAMKKPKPP